MKRIAATLTATAALVALVAAPTEAAGKVQHISVTKGGDPSTGCRWVHKRDLVVIDGVTYRKHVRHTKCPGEAMRVETAYVPV